MRSWLFAKSVANILSSRATMPYGPVVRPASVAVRAERVSKSTIVSVPDPELVAYSVLPLGLIDISKG